MAKKEKKRIKKVFGFPEARKFIGSTIVAMAFLLMSLNSANAVPSLGVATEGTYFLGLDKDGNVEPFEAYQSYFASDSVFDGENHGFEVFSSGEELHVFTNNTDEDIWLLAENSFADNNLSFGGDSLDLPFGAENDKIASFIGPFLGLNLGVVLDSNGDPNDGWTLLPMDPFQPGPFYEFSAPLTFDGVLPPGGYLFAVADNFNAFYDKQKGVRDEKSPATTSSFSSEPEPIPEPTTIALLGIGLAGLAGAEVRRRRKKKAVDNS